jgi:phosphoribosylanthranilate isomerase
VSAQVCGLISVQSALLSYEAGADLLGLIFAPGSKRQLKLDTAASIVAAVRAEARSRVQAAGQHDALNGSGGAGLVTAQQAQEGWLSSQARSLLQLVRHRRASSALPLFVGVFVDASVEEMNAVALQLGLDLIQLHGGDADPLTISRLCRPAVRVVPVIPMETTADDCIKACEAHGQSTGGHEQPAAAVAPRPTLTVCPHCVAAGGASYVLLDTKLGSAGSGGTGVTFDWRIASAVAARFPVWLAGGLTPDNVQQAVQAIHPLLVDVSSGVDRADGSLEKDVEKVRLFVQRARAGQQAH